MTVPGAFSEDRGGTSVCLLLFGAEGIATAMEAAYGKLPTYDPKPDPE